LIPGEEISSNAPSPDGGRRLPIHTNAIDADTTIGEIKGETKVEILQKQVDATHQANGTPSLNHPNFSWALTPEDIGAVKKLRHFEIYNGHPLVNNLGGGGVPSCEDIWDVLLSRGI